METTTLSSYPCCESCKKEFNDTCHKPIRFCKDDHTLCDMCFKEIRKNQKNLHHNKESEIITNGENQQSEKPQQSEESEQTDIQNEFELLIGPCPFEGCENLVNSEAITTNYQTLSSVNYVKYSLSNLKEKDNSIAITAATNDDCQFEQIGRSFSILMEFLTEKDKLNLTLTNSALRCILMSSVTWGEFEITSFIGRNAWKKEKSEMQSLWDLRMKWCWKYFSVIKPSVLKINVHGFENDTRLLSFFLHDTYPWVENLTISCNSEEIHLAAAQSCYNAHTLVVSSPVFSNSLFENMTTKNPGGMKNITSLSVLKDDSEFTAKNISFIFPVNNTLETLILKEHLLEFDEILKLAHLHEQSLAELELDVETCSESTLLDIITSIPNVHTLRLYHLEYFHQEEKFAKCLSNSVRELCLSKAYDLPMFRIIEKIATPKLLVIEFIELNEITDKEIELLAKNCPNLKKIDVCWCIKIGEKSMRSLIESCQSLTHLNVTGLKELKDEVFGKEYTKLLEYFNETTYDKMKHTIASTRKEKKQHNQQHNQHKEKLENLFIESSNIEHYFDIEKINHQSNEKLHTMISNLKNLKKIKNIICISCNSISDKILKLIHIVNRNTSVVNYYNDKLDLWAEDEFNNSNDDDEDDW